MKVKCSYCRGKGIDWRDKNIGNVCPKCKGKGYTFKK